MRTVRLLATLRDLAGSREIDVPFENGGTVRELIVAVNAVCPQIGEQILDDAGEMTGLVHVFVHGRSVQWLEGLDTVITDSDELLLVPPIAGG